MRELRLFGKSIIGFGKPEAVERAATTSLSNPAPWLLDAIGAKSNAGVPVNTTTALTLATIFRCIANISEDISKLPISFSKRTANGDYEAYEDLPAHRLLNGEASPGIASITFKHALMAAAVLTGNGYAFIFRNEYYEPESLLIIDRSRVIPYVFNGILTYHITPNPVDSISGTYAHTDILHIRAFTMDGLTGISPIRYGTDSMGIGIAAQQYAAKFYTGGGQVEATLESDKILEPDGVVRLKQSFLASIQNDKLAILVDGLKYTKIGMNPEDAQLLESRQWSTEDMCRWFRMPPHKVQHLANATFSNIEEQNIEYITDCLMTWGRRLEEEAEAKLLPESLKGQVHARISYDEFMRGNATARADYTSKMINNGVMSPNEARRLEHINGYEGGDRHYIQVNMQPVDQIDQLMEIKLIGLAKGDTKPADPARSTPPPTPAPAQ